MATTIYDIWVLRDEAGQIAGVSYAPLTGVPLERITEATYAECQAYLHPAPPSPLEEPIPVDIFWQAAEDLLGLTKYAVMAATMADPALSEAEKMDALVNIAARDRYRRDDPNVGRLSTALGYPSEQMDSLWVYVLENYV
jgi:hypothetical protein